MEPQTQKTQIVELLRGAENIVVTVSQKPDIDQIAAAIALAELLHKLDKHADAVVSEAVPSQLDFLSTGLLKKSFSGIRDFVVSIDTGEVEADKLKYVPEDKKLKVYITPFNGNYTADDVEFGYGEYHCDAVVALGVDQTAQIDKQMANQKELLGKTKLVTLNIGDGGGGEGLNWHVATASSICELVMSIIESLQPDILDGDIATAILTGIIAKTDHFTNDLTSAKVMNIASQLMAVGAQQAEIISHLKAQPKAPAKADERERGPLKHQPGSKPKEDGELESGEVQELPHKGKKPAVEPPESSESVPTPAPNVSSPPPLTPIVPLASAPKPPAASTPSLAPIPPSTAPAPKPPLAPLSANSDHQVLPANAPVVENNPFSEAITKPPTSPASVVPPPPALPPIPPPPKPPGVSDVKSDMPLGSNPPPVFGSPLPPAGGLKPLPPLPPTQPGDIARPSAPVSPAGPLPPVNPPSMPPSPAASPPTPTGGVATSPPAPEVPMGPNNKPDIEAARRAVEEAEKDAPTPPPPPVNPPITPSPPPAPAK